MAHTSTHSGMRHKKSTCTTQNEPALLENVRSRAYELYESRGREDGHDLDDWLLAKKEVTDLAGKRKRH